jgi:hypothetical protein
MARGVILVQRVVIVQLELVPNEDQRIESAVEGLQVPLVTLGGNAGYLKATPVFPGEEHAGGAVQLVFFRDYLGPHPVPRRKVGILTNPTVEPVIHIPVLLSEMRFNQLSFVHNAAGVGQVYVDTMAATHCSTFLNAAIGYRP